MTTRVMHVVTRCVAGAGGVAVRGAVALDPGRYESVLVTGTREGALLDRARAARVEVVVVPELVSPIQPREDATAFGRLLDLVHEWRPDVVHTHSAKAGALGRMAASRSGVPLIVHTLHGFPFHEFQNPALRAAYIRIERRLSRVTDAYLAVGTGVAVEALRRGLARPDQLHTIGPAVDEPSVRLDPVTRARGRALLGLPDDVPVLGTVGRLDFQKAPEVMLEALRRMRTPAVLVWAGDGELAERTRRDVHRLGLDARVHLLGNRSDVAALLPAFDVFAMASRYEGLPCVVVEAQQCGIPVVATAVNAVPDVVIPGETGLLVPPGRADLLAAAVDHVFAHPEEARLWAAHAQAHLGDRYDQTTAGEVLDRVYSQGAAQPRRQLVGFGGTGPSRLQARVS
ncbi:glycosyltransferase [Intrasporangium sp. YIM S08009]|uniref:glycosyltransferase n=1 Tax=Intrasporangium zincisolvens TaxID=3080018 RepID=UPI002B0605E2|nr:glycosyltransferase [Intrasporangium sp. YIM S08009]